MNWTPWLWMPGGKDSHVMTEAHKPYDLTQNEGLRYDGKFIREECNPHRINVVAYRCGASFAFFAVVNIASRSSDCHCPDFHGRNELVRLETADYEARFF